MGDVVERSKREVAKKSVRKVGKVIKGLKDFMVHGSSFELAVGVVIGGATTALVNAIVQGVFNPIIAAIGGVDDLSKILVFNWNGATVSFGLVLSAFVNLLIVTAVVYFGFILPLNKLNKFTKKDVPDYSKMTVDLLKDIKDELASK